MAKEKPERVAVVLFNLGGPDRPESIRPYLFRFFMDPRIIRVAFPLRLFIAGLISLRRSRRQAAAAYGRLGGRSPLYENTHAQATALEKTLNEQAPAGKIFKCFVCMRYWHPLTAYVVREVAAWSPQRIVRLPLYPQFSTTTTGSSFAAWERAAEKAGLKTPTASVCCYPTQEGFIEASAQNILATYNKALEEAAHKNLPPPRVLFSAHGLPEDIVAGGDPYQWQIEKTAKAIVGQLKIPGLDWALCYQSRVGPKKWIGPSIFEALRDAAGCGAPVIVYPLAFVSEHVETLVEIEIEYRRVARELGVPYYARVPTAGVHPAFIDGLAKMALDYTGRSGLYSQKGARLCPTSLRQCCMAGPHTRKGGENDG